MTEGTSPRSGSELAVRLLAAPDVGAFVDLVVSHRELLGGSRDPRVIRAIATDAVRPDRPVFIVIAERGGALCGAMVVLVGGAAPYWASLPRHHPVVGAHLAYRRARKLVRQHLPASAIGRLDARGAEPVPPAPRLPLPPALADDPRLHVPPPPAGAPGPHFRESGPHLAFGPLVLVADHARGLGVATRLHHGAFDELRRRGVDRYDASFVIDYEPSIRMHLGLGFTVHRHPGGFFGSLDLREVDEVDEVDGQQSASTAPTTVRLLDRSEHDRWDALVEREGCLQQATWWAAPLEGYGVSYAVVGRFAGPELTGGLLVRFAKVPYLPLAVGDSLGGPVGSGWDRAGADALLAELAGVGRSHRAIRISFRSVPGPVSHRALVRALAGGSARWERKAEPGRAVVDLEGRTIDEVVAGFRQNARRFLRKGQKGPVEVRSVRTPADLRAAMDAFEATAERKGFSELRPWPALEPLMRHGVETGQAEVLGAFVDDRMVAATFVSYVGHEAEYVYGGFHLDAAPLHPNHVLHHRGIEEAIARGKRGYDLGMLGGTERSAGVDAFKRSFGAEAVSLHDTLHWELRPHLARAMAAVRSQTWGKRAVNALRRVAVRRFDATSGAETAP